MRSIFALAAFVAAFFMAGPAAARDGCDPSLENALKLLADEYNELPVARAINSKGWLVVITASEKKGSWTVIETDPNTGLTCLLSTGIGWQALKYDGPET